MLNLNKSKRLLLASKHKIVHLPNLSPMLDGNAIEEVTSQNY